MEVGNLSIPVTADLGPLEKQLQELHRRLGQVEGQTGGVQRSMQGVERQTRGLTSALAPLAVALAGVFSVKALIQFTDTWTDLTSRVNLAAGSIETGAAVMDQLQVIARRTYSSLQQTTEGYIRNAQTLRDLGRSTQDTLNYTEALNNALVVSGARADRAARVQEALGRGLAAGALRGQELNTVIESGGRVAELLAEELGTTVSGLRKFGQEGKITGDIIDRALVGNLEKLREEADSMPATIGDAFQLISNALLQTIGVFDSANEISGTLATSLIFVADNMQRVISTVAAGVAGWLGYQAAVLAVNAGLFTTAGALALVQTALRRLLVSSAIGILVVAVGELVNIVWDARKATDSWSEAWGRLGTFFQQVSYAMQDAFKGAVLGMQGVWSSFIAYFLQSTQAALGAFGVIFNVADQIKVAETDSRQLLAGAAVRFEDAAVTLKKAYADLREGIGGAVDLSGDGGPNRVVPGDDGKGKKSKAEREAERLREIYANLLRDGRAFIEQQQIEQQAIGMTELEAAKLRATFDLLNQAQRAGINLTAAQTEELTNLAHQMAEAEYATAKLQERYDFAKDTFKGFFTDLKSELQNGASVWEAFGTAAANALQKIADKALDMALNGIFDLIFGAFGGSGGGGGGFFSKLFGFENGTSFAPGGWSVVGERGPELLKLPAGSQVIPNHRVTAPAQASFGGGGMSQQSRMAIDIFVKDDGKIGAIARQEAGDVVEVSIREYDAHQLPKSFERVGNHQRMR